MSDEVQRLIPHERGDGEAGGVNVFGIFVRNKETKIFERVTKLSREKRQLGSPTVGFRFLSGSGNSIITEEFCFYQL